MNMHSPPHSCPVSIIRLRSLFVWIGLIVAQASVCVAQTAAYGLETGKPPEKTAEPYAPEFFKKLDSLTRFGLAISKDGRECYYAVALNDNGRFREEIRFTRLDDEGVWARPQPLMPSEKKYKYVDPHFAPDGERLFFIYTKPATKENAAQRQMFDIWYVRRSENGWTAPVNVAAPISTNNAHEYFVSLTWEEKLFFGSNRGNNNFDLYSARLGGAGQYDNPVPLPGKVNTDKYEADVFVARDESYIIFSSSGRKDGRGQGDLYVSFRNNAGSWGAGINLGDGVNSNQQEFAPSISEDQKVLFFSRGGVIHWVSTDVIDALRP